MMLINKSNQSQIFSYINVWAPTWIWWWRHYLEWIKIAKSDWICESVLFVFPSI